MAQKWRVKSLKEKSPLDLSNFLSKLYFSQTSWKHQIFILTVLSSLKLELLKSLPMHPPLNSSQCFRNQAHRSQMKGIFSCTTIFFLLLSNFLVTCFMFQFFWILHSIMFPTKYETVMTIMRTHNKFLYISIYKLSLEFIPVSPTSSIFRQWSFVTFCFRIRSL